MKKRHYGIVFFLILILFFITGTALIVFGIMSNATINQLKVHPFFTSRGVNFFNQFQQRSIWGGFFLITSATILFFFKEKLIAYCSTEPGAILKKFRQLKEVLPTQSKKTYFIALGILLAISFTLRLIFSTSSLHYDEGFTYYYFAKKPLYLLLSTYDYPNNHVLHTLLVKLSYLLFGDHILSLRLPALIAGISIVLLLFAYLRSSINNKTALLAATLSACTPFLFSYSINARGYTLLTCFFLTGLLAINRLKKDPSNRKHTILFILSQVLGIYTIPSMLYGTFVLTVYYLIHSYSEKRLKQSGKQILLWLIFICWFTTLLYLPVCILSGFTTIIANEYVKASESLHLVDTINFLRSIGASLSDNMGIILQLIFFAGLITALYVQKNFRFLFLAITILFATIILIQGVLPPVRVFSFLFPLIYGMSAAGIFHLIDKTPFHSPKHSLLICGIFFTLITLNSIQKQSYTDKYDFTPLRYPNQLFDYLHTHLQSDDKILTQFPLEASIRSYCYFNHIPEKHLNYKASRPNRVYLITQNKKEQTADFCLKKNEVDTRQFLKEFYPKKILKFGNEVVVLCYWRK